MAIGSRLQCIVCGARNLQLLCVLQTQGVPHGEPGHNVSYDRALVSICATCGCGQLEKYSHDCWSIDEDWDMYWWYALPSADTSRLRQWLRACPTPQNGQCDCEIHQQLRTDTRRLAGAVPHASAPEAQARFAWLALDQQGAQLQLRIDPQREIAQTAR